MNGERLPISIVGPIAFAVALFAVGFTGSVVAADVDGHKSCPPEQRDYLSHIDLLMSSGDEPALKEAGKVIQKAFLEDNWPDSCPLPDRFRWAIGGDCPPHYHSLLEQYDRYEDQLASEDGVAGATLERLLNHTAATALIVRRSFELGAWPNSCRLPETLRAIPAEVESEKRAFLLFGLKEEPVCPPRQSEYLQYVERYIRAGDAKAVAEAGKVISRAFRDDDWPLGCSVPVELKWAGSIHAGSAGPKTVDERLSLKGNGPKHSLSGKPCPKGSKLSGKPPPKGTAQACVAKKTGTKLGPFAGWDKAGVLREAGNYLDDVRHGRWTKWNAEGVKVSEGDFDGGKKHGGWTTLDVETGTRSFVLWEHGLQIGTAEIGPNRGITLTCGDAPSPLYSEDASGNWTFAEGKEWDSQLDEEKGKQAEACAERMCAAGFSESRVCNAAMAFYYPGLADADELEVRISISNFSEPEKKQWNSRLAWMRLYDNLRDSNLALLTKEEQVDQLKQAWVKIQQSAAEWRMVMGETWVVSLEREFLEAVALWMLDPPLFETFLQELLAQGRSTLAEQLRQLAIDSLNPSFDEKSEEYALSVRQKIALKKAWAQLLGAAWVEEIDKRLGPEGLKLLEDVTPELFPVKAGGSCPKSNSVRSHYPSVQISKRLGSSIFLSPENFSDATRDIALTRLRSAYDEEFEATSQLIRTLIDSEETVGLEHCVYHLRIMFIDGRAKPHPPNANESKTSFDECEGTGDEPLIGGLSCNDFDDLEARLTRALEPQGIPQWVLPERASVIRGQAERLAEEGIALVNRVKARKNAEWRRKEANRKAKETRQKQKYTDCCIACGGFMRFSEHTKTMVCRANDLQAVCVNSCQLAR